MASAFHMDYPQNKVMIMDQAKLTSLVKKYALELGADLVGVAPVSRYERAPSMLKPQAHLPEAQSVIVMAIHHPDGSVNFGAEPNSNFSGGFQVGMIPKLDTMSLRMSKFIEKLGFTAIPMSCTYYWRHRKYKSIPYDHASSFSHLNAFVAAGLGEYGWHGMVMSPKYGPRQRLVSVITNVLLTPDPLYSGEPLCDRCGLCEKACWGQNYKPENLLPGTISFTIEGKKFEHANINRWRCFWGEQCHLDMNLLASKENLKEEDLYKAIKNGTTRTGIGNAGYMCSSFKYCMSKPVRSFDRKKAPNPLRKKNGPTMNTEKMRDTIIELAQKAGADRISILPLSKFESLRDVFYEGFRVDDFYNTYKWVISIGRELPDYLAESHVPLAEKNLPPIEVLNCGRMMIGTVDIARMIDDAGYDAIQDWWLSGISPLAAKLTGWDAVWHSRNPHGAHDFAHDVDGAGLEHPRVAVQSVICNADLSELITLLPGVMNDIDDFSFFTDVKKGRLPNVELAGAARIDDLPAESQTKLRAIIPNAKSLLVLGASLPRRMVELAASQEAECAISYNFANYQAMREACWTAQDVASALKAKGFASGVMCEIDDTSVWRKTPLGGLPDLRAQAPFAVAAGLGFRGRHGFLISPEFGPCQRFGFVLTEAELPHREKITGSCPEGCHACADACPVNALNIEPDKQIFDRNEVRCEWALALGMVEGEGTGMSGYRVPNLPVPEKLDDELRKAALEHKDPIQVLGYQRPNQGDTPVERCLQVCPLAKTGFDKN